MYVLYGNIKLFLPYTASLKDKRQIIQSITDRLKKRFSISVSEVDHHDLWQRSDLGFAAACNNYGETELILNSIQDTLEKYEDSCEITDFKSESLKYDY